MNTLRAKLTALLVGAILLVVMLATGVSWLLLVPPRFERAEDATASQVSLLIDLAQGGRPVASTPFAGIHDAQAGGPVLEWPSAGVNAAMERRGRVERVMVSDPPDAQWPVISAQLHDGRWLVMPMSVGPQHGGNRWALAGWALIIALGTTLVMVIAVRRLTEPLALLERAVAAIGPDGDLAPLPEEGPTEVRAAATAVNRLSTRLKSAMESRMRLVAAAGHDLRTPMTRMRLRAEFLEESERETWIEDLNELDRIADSAIRLVREEVEGTAGEVLQLDRLVVEVAEELSGIGLDVAVESTEPVTIRARPLSLKRAIRNLAINAATHGAEAKIRVQREGARAMIVIEDRGPGIPEELLPRVFEPFFRIDPARNAPIPGAGLGLAIAHEIIARNGGVLVLRNLFGHAGLQQRAEFDAIDAPAA